MAVFNNRNGNDVFRGLNSEYDQVDYAGRLRDYTFTRNDNGSVTVTHPTFGTDTLWSIEGFWFSGEARWYSIDDAIQLTAGSGGFIDENGTITGTTGNNNLVGTNGTDIFYGDRGNDTFDGRGDEYDQVEYDGELIEYTFTQNANGSVTASHPTWGRDTLIDIDGFWFMREQAWYSIEDAIALTQDLPTFRLDADDVLNGTPGNDVMRAEADGTNFYGGTGNDRFIGRSNAYDQVNFDGDVEDYVITANNNGSFTFEHPVWGRDTLVNIDGIWFNGKGEWYTPEDAARANNIVSDVLTKAQMDSVYQAPIELPEDDSATIIAEYFDAM
ncbi:hypothetical protein ACJ3XI_11510 [Litorimonas sp. RW-G-Af-16]|uniref:hypothetical protein n=1 Tax=Litorimonas sp. RW-G-Af-16 TaxID=3241168 RepID=UPI00390CCF2E